MVTGGAQLKIVGKFKGTSVEHFLKVFTKTTIINRNLRNTFGVKEDISFILYVGIPI